MADGQHTRGPGEVVDAKRASGREESWYRVGREYTGGMSAMPSDSTLNPNLKSWVESANDPNTDFPIQNLPMCRYVGEDDRPSIGMAVGDKIVDLDLLFHADLIDSDDEELMGRLHHGIHTGDTGMLLKAHEDWRVLRTSVQAFLLDGPAGGQQARRIRQKAVLNMAELTLLTPTEPRNYTDFYASVHHAQNVGAMFRPDNALLPNYKHVPIGYHGRASSVIASGTPVARPKGQTRPDEQAPPVFGPCKRLDYELEVGCVIGAGNDLGLPVSIADAHELIFGLCLVNDWSARDIQAWEYQPLGPFLAKNFATTMSPFVVTRDALEPFRVAGPARSAGDPEPLPYLRGPSEWGFDLHLEVLLQSAKMRAANLAPHRVSRGNLKEMFWTFPQMIAHHTSGGCNLEPGDLIASGTVSGPEEDSRGCLLERTWVGHGPDKKPLARKPITLPTGEERLFLEDGDEVIMRGWCERAGYRRIGFGECRGEIVARPT